ncbi:MAG: hypothetical protein CO029_01955 [Candidatus Magasanikbacteria bacterium CG_4_9_14_0_2_um_filter_41_10]|uniref:Uncharacterized protein n=1 Tax=Candidatus Magasanikbacteria bacterium CG_4_10_14_0_2_um_filter_41_31 TaxID=1974639 RepID=A0A2M7V5K8_9BACT|nr:MAG: hypothetical protein AUJ37_02085 [Candidatus Magasanikbacteria bacterium CG1_02_41_34]PIZ93880.1 MAG: hypothetical protein COX83_00745 [Candidatus Magasanikbacteria bacterium CG_4_10_14_0_2_um_filter_41_31]PJC53600.1 MAG: hypothetical protein CO029_01955 [Candidatus Magasanikbacteria bacterium CG_4_9_14_0_2_um_filter_41_10]
MLDIRQRLFLIVSIAVLLVLAIVLSILGIKKYNDTTSVKLDIIQQESGSGEEQPQMYDASLNLQPVIGDPQQLGSVLANEDETERFVRQRSIDFVERFLSYSNQSRNTHIRDVLPLVTPEMASWIETQSQHYSDIYQGSTTQVIVSRIENVTDQTASVHVEAQQHLESKDIDERVYHVGRVELVETNGVWYVDGLYWE